MFLVVLGLSFVAMIIGAASSALLPEKVYGTNANGTTVTLKKGEALRVSLPENPSTGYSWDLSLSDGLYLVSDQYIRDDTGIRRVGAGGIHTWDIRATGIGLQQINGVYRRPWEVNAAPEKTYALNIHVSGGGGLQSASDNRWNLPRMFRFSIGKYPESLMLVN